MQEKNETKNSSVLLFLRPIENNEERVRIFGENFVKNNRDKCKIKFKNGIYDLKEYFEDIDEKYNHKDEIRFFLIGINNINDISYLFSDCNKLSSILIFSIKDNLIYILIQLIMNFLKIIQNNLLLIKLIPILRVKKRKQIFTKMIPYFL